MLLLEVRLTKKKTYKFLQEVRVYIEIIVRVKAPGNCVQAAGAWRKNVLC